MPGGCKQSVKQSLCSPGGETFELRHGGAGACGIPDGESIVMTGGFGHSFVTRSRVNDAEVTFISTP